jgi:peroxiredoxin family protein
MTLSLIASGAVAADMEVKIFAMNDAVWALRKDMVGTDTTVHSHYPSFASEITKSMSEGKIIPWWELMADLKEMGEITITACALVADVAMIEQDDFHELVDDIAGVANFAADIDDSDFVLSI